MIKNYSKEEFIVAGIGFSEVERGGRPDLEMMERGSQRDLRDWQDRRERERQRKLARKKKMTLEN